MWASFFKDKDGNTVVWQSPNMPLVVGLVTHILKQVLPFGNLAYVAELISFGALFTWAWLEIFHGASYFRRMAGVVVMWAIIISRIT